MSPSERDATPPAPDQSGAGSVRGLDTHLAHRLPDDFAASGTDSGDCR
jgi:hypothetical protein